MLILAHPLIHFYYYLWIGRRARFLFVVLSPATKPTVVVVVVRQQIVIIQNIIELLVERAFSYKYTYAPIVVRITYSLSFNLRTCVIVFLISDHRCRLRHRAPRQHASRRYARWIALLFGTGPSLLYQSGKKWNQNVSIIRIVVIVKLTILLLCPPALSIHSL